MDKMTLLKTFLAASVAGGIALSANGQFVYVNEDFESGIGNWTLGAGGSLDTEFGNPSMSGHHNGSGNVTTWNGGAFSLTPTSGLNIVLMADIYHTGVGNQRNTVGLRNGADPLFEMGYYNAFTSHISDPSVTPTSTGSGLGVRILNFAGDENWLMFASASVDPQWNRWEATFSTTGLTVRLDLGANGTWDIEYTSLGAPSANPFVDLRFGGPSNLASSGGGFNVDNIGLETVIPEPGTYAAIFGGLALLGAFVYRRRLSVKK